jgi:hypothetical protein
VTGPVTNETTDPAWVRFVKSPLVSKLWLLAVTILLGILVLNSQHQARVARDQVCTVFERNANDAVDQLSQTYDYLSVVQPPDLVGKEPASNLNVAVLTNVPNLERRAKAVTAPEFCLEDGVGVPDPPKPVPDRPAHVTYLLDSLHAQK